MKVLQQTTNKIIFEKSAASIFGCIFGLIFSIPPLVMISSAVYNIGITSFRCDRITPTLVNCQKKQSKLFGLIPGSSTSFARITKAEYIYEKHSETHTDSDGDEHEHVVEYSLVELIDNNFRKMEVFSDNDFPSRAAMSNSAAEINNFIKSPAPNFSIQQDFRLAQFINILPGIAFLSIFLLIGIAIIYFSLQSENWIFNKSSHLLSRKKTTLMGTKTVSTESFTNFQELQIIEGKDSDGDTYYDLKLLLKSANKYEIFSSSSLPEVEKFAKNLSNFLQISVNKIISDKNARTY